MEDLKLAWKQLSLIKKISILFFGPILLLMIASNLLNDATPANATAAIAESLITQNTTAFKESVTAKINSDDSWEGIEWKFEKQSVSATLWYKSLQTSATKVAYDTKQINKAILDQLIAEGRKPSDEWLSVNVHAHSREPGVTGKPMVRNYGTARYDFNTDSINFDQAK